MKKRQVLISIIGFILFVIILTGFINASIRVYCTGIQGYGSEYYDIPVRGVETFQGPCGATPGTSCSANACSLQSGACYCNTYCASATDCTPPQWVNNGRYGFGSGGGTGGCTDTSWNPATNTICKGVSFNQTSNCGRNRTAIGTKFCFFNNSLDTGLISMWTMDSDDGSNANTAVDVFGSHDGDVKNGAAQVAGKKEQAYSLDGVNDYIDIGKLNEFDTSGQKTVALWVKVNELGNNVPISKYQSDNNNRDGWIIQFTGGTIKARIKNNTNDENASFQATSTYETNKWYYVVMTWNTAAGGKVSLYVDGALKSQSQNIAGSFGGNTQNLLFGNSYQYDGSLSNSAWFNGTLDEIAIWSRVLNSSEVSDLYNHYTGGSPQLPACNSSFCSSNQCGIHTYPTCTGTINCSTVNTCARGCNLTSGMCIFPACNSSFCSSNQCGTWSFQTCNGVVNCSVNRSCSSGTSCNSSISGMCISPEVNSCSDYKTNVTCNAYHPSVIARSINNSQSCGFSQVIDGCTARINCNCVWQGNSCIGQKNIVQQCPSGSINASNCTWFPVELQNQACTDPSKPIVARFRAEFKPGSLNDQSLRAECVDIVREYPCVSTEKLPFFTAFNFVLSLAVIVLIYCILIKKQ